MSDRTVHAETPAAEVVRYERAGVWYIEDKAQGVYRGADWRTRMPLKHIVEWITEQPQRGVKYYFGRPGGRLFDKYVRDEITRIGGHL